MPTDYEKIGKLLTWEHIEPARGTRFSDHSGTSIERTARGKRWSRHGRMEANVSVAIGGEGSLSATKDLMARCKELPRSHARIPLNYWQ